MTTINTDGKPGYVYNQATDTWYQIAGKTDTSGSFEWAGSHKFLSTAEFIDHLTSKDGINNFLNPAARDAAIPSPNAGNICFVRTDSLGAALKELQYYNGSAWVALVPSALNKTDQFLKSNGIISVWSTIPDPITISFLMMGG